MDFETAKTVKPGSVIRVHELFTEVLNFQFDELANGSCEIYLHTNYGMFHYSVCEKASTIDLNYYINFEGKRRFWKYEDADRPKGICYDCEIPYSKIADMHIPNAAWDKINPAYRSGAGLLCPNCICDRLRVVDSGSVFATIYPASFEW